MLDGLVFEEAEHPMRDGGQRKKTYLNEIVVPLMRRNKSYQSEKVYVKYFFILST